MTADHKPEWMQDESLNNIPVEKLEYLNEMFQQTKAKKGKALMQAVMPLLSKAKALNLTFTKEEMNLAIKAIQSHSSPEELSQIDAFLKKQSKVI